MKVGLTNIQGLHRRKEKGDEDENGMTMAMTTVKSSYRHHHNQYYHEELYKEKPYEHSTPFVLGTHPTQKAITMLL